MARKAAWILSILVLANTGLLGLYNGVSELADAQTPLQRSVTIGVLLYGVLGLAALVALIVRHAAAIWLAVGWAIVVTYVASTAAIAYAGDDASVGGAIAAGGGAALIGLGVVWCARMITRPASLHDRVHASSDAR
jgi:hypothetical protein